MTLMRETSGPSPMRLGTLRTAVSAPSTRKRTIVNSASCSTWMSEARMRTARAMRWLTRRTTGGRTSRSTRGGASSASSAQTHSTASSVGRLRRRSIMTASGPNARERSSSTSEGSA
ncbi:MAG: hypothetical protein FD126_1129 [Elusimicrobia bacterium]|nr:MAG: hypothetical protein FD126_1129 [Elusimicrobiota bacterium]